MENHTARGLADHYADLLTILRNDGYSFREIANQIGQITGAQTNDKTVRRAFAKIAARLAAASEPDKPDPLPPIVDESPVADADEPIADLLARRIRETKRTLRREATKHRVCAMDGKPFGLMIFGDPHLDDPGCDWPQLIEHVETVSGVDGVYCVNIGDTQNSWVGFLTKKYADQATTAAEGWRLVKWFIGQTEGVDANVNWLAWVSGNHDHWANTPGLDPYAELCRLSGVRYYDANEVRLKIRFPEARSITVELRHDYRGRSWFHATHGLHKAAMLDGAAGDSIYVAGHLHQWSTLAAEHKGGRTSLAVRVRGYKYADEYARKLGVHSCKYGAAVLIVVDPNAEGPARFTPFWDIKHGVDVLSAMREGR